MFLPPIVLVSLSLHLAHVSPQTPAARSVFAIGLIFSRAHLHAPRHSLPVEALAGTLIIGGLNFQAPRRCSRHAPPEPDSFPGGTPTNRTAA